MTMLRTLLPAIFLACSWTWCIGMFLPVLLVRDFGWPAFLVFLIPNCLGAMSVGLLLRHPDQARELSRLHARAILAFSAITIVFHLLFLTWIIRLVGIVPQWTQGLVPFLALIIGAALSRIRTTGWYRLAPFVMLLSAACALLAWITTGKGATYAAPPLHGEYSYIDLAAAAPVIAFGFLLCPFLDVSFVRTRQELPDPAGRNAFVLAFSIFFPLLMLFTLSYAMSFLGRAWLSYYFPLHMFIQSCFTVGVHWRELAPRTGQRSRKHLPITLRIRRLSAGLALACVLAAAGVALIVPRLSSDHAEYAYKLFLSAYALIFPLYVWIMMTPHVTRMIPSARQRLRCWATGCILGAPLLWLGYLHANWLLLPPAVLLLLAMPWIWRAVLVRKSHSRGVQHA